jgi:uncharacterized protein YbbC (DUF1343 family)
MLLIFIIFLFSNFTSGFCTEISPPKVLVGSDLLFSEPYADLLRGKRIGLIANQTAVNSKMQSTLDLLTKHSFSHSYTIAALFAPEHGLTGAARANEELTDSLHSTNIPIFSLFGNTTRPTAEMLKTIDLLIYDIQDIGSRSYTYIATLFFAMEEAAKYKIPMLVLDRPNPINGITVDGPLLEDKWRSMIGYINVPYCHGMTVGELALYFNKEYRIGCDVKVIPMKGWKRRMTFQDTGLCWIPTSPQIPEASTPLYYPVTGIIGELSLVNIGVGYTLPFKLIGAPWIDSEILAKTLNEQKLPGIQFKPFQYRPFYGKFAKEDCNGVLIQVTNPLTYKPVAAQFLLLGTLKNLYPKKFQEALDAKKSIKRTFAQVNGTEEVFTIMTTQKHIIWPLRSLHLKEREKFMFTRTKYLNPDYE